MKLIVYKNEQQVDEFDLGAIFELHNKSESMEFSVGRSEDCHVVLNDQKISRHHATILKTLDKWEIIKKSSVGAIFLNGSPVEKQELKTGDILNIGSYQIHILAKILDVTHQEPKSSLEDSTIPYTTLDKESEPSIINTQESVKEEDHVEESKDPEDFSVDTENSNENIESLDDNEEFKTEEVKNVDENIEEFKDNEEVFIDDKNDEFPSFDSDSTSSGMDLGDSNEKTSIISTFATFELSLFGEHAPYDRYILEENEVFIGRNADKCQIILNDSEVSSVHAVIKKNIMGYHLEDLNSSNGTILNGERINKVELNEDDEFIIGSTTFTIKVSSDLINAESERLMPVDENQEITVEEVIEEEVDFGETDASIEDLNSPDKNAKKKSLVDKWKALPPKKRLIYGLVAIFMVFLLLSDDDKPKKGTPTKNKNDYALNKKVENDKKEENVTQKKIILSKADEEFVEAAYQLAKAHLQAGKYDQALQELNKIIAIAPEYKNTPQLFATSKEGLAKLEEMNRKIKEEEDRKIRMAKVKDLLVKAKQAVNDKKVELAEALFAQIFEYDPENIDVPQLKLEIDAWKKEQERIAFEKEKKEAERKRMLDALAPGRNFYLQKEWFKAVMKLQDFLKIKNTDEDLIKNATEMLSKAKKNLELLTSPLLGKARSLKEGQDLKGAYETYLEISKIDPSSAEALNEMDEIRESLNNRSKKIYREALVSESLSLFDDAREKFEEVKQISPTDGEYYIKADEKLKGYW